MRIAASALQHSFAVFSDDRHFRECHIKHILAADVKHILAPQQQYTKGARCALGTQIGVGLGCYAEPKQGGLVRRVATLCFMRWPLYTLCDSEVPGLHVGTRLDDFLL
jgi:hypothetical protein